MGRGRREEEEKIADKRKKKKRMERWRASERESGKVNSLEQSDVTLFLLHLFPAKDVWAQERRGEGEVRGREGRKRLIQK